MRFTPAQHDQIRSALRIAAAATRAKADKLRDIGTDNEDIAAEVARLAEGWEAILTQLDTPPAPRAPRTRKSKGNTDTGPKAVA